jgi:hypothetical protein
LSFGVTVEDATVVCETGAASLLASVTAPTDAATARVIAARPNLFSIAFPVPVDPGILNRLWRTGIPPMGQKLSPVSPRKDQGSDQEQVNLRPNEQQRHRLPGNVHTQTNLKRRRFHGSWNADGTPS